MIIARGSAFECIAILEFLNEDGDLNEATYRSLYASLEEVSKMLYAMIGNLQGR